MAPTTLATADKATTKNGSAAPAMVQANPFVRASTQTVEGAFHDKSTQMTGSAIQVQDVDVPSFGFIRSVILKVTLSGGSGSGTPAVADEDAPFNVLQDITLKDVNGRPLVGPLSGFDLYLADKWGGYTFADDQKLGPLYSAVDGDGDTTFFVRVPVEVSERDGLGALPNQNSSATYKVSYTVAGSGTVYSTPPAPTLPSVRVQAYCEFWSPVEPADPFGKPNVTQPPAVGTTQHWTKSTPDIGGGDRRVRMTRVGNMIRTLIFVLRTAAGARTTDDFPDDFRVELDQRNLFVQSRDVLRQQMWERSGHATLDTGVLVLTWAADLDGKIGFEMRDQWLATTEATRLELVGSFGGSASSLQVLTNDIAPVGQVHI